MRLALLHEDDIATTLRRTGAEQQRLRTKWQAKKRQKKKETEKGERNRTKQREQATRQGQREQDTKERKRQQRRSRLAAARQSKQMEKLSDLLDKALSGFD